jgi:hypothetical protein
MTPSEKEKFKFYFEMTHTNDTHSFYKCRFCSAKRIVKKGSTGHRNLSSHVDIHHPDWKTEMDQAVQPGTIDKWIVVDKKAENAFAWLKWVVGENREVDFVNKPLVRHLHICFPFEPF